MEIAGSVAEGASRNSTVSEERSEGGRGLKNFQGTQQMAAVSSAFSESPRVACIT